jgi:hypothetical protein
VPLDSIDGTHIPTNIPSSRCPVNHNRIEKIKEIKAARQHASTAFCGDTIGRSPFLFRLRKLSPVRSAKKALFCRQLSTLCAEHEFGSPLNIKQPISIPGKTYRGLQRQHWIANLLILEDRRETPSIGFSQSSLKASSRANRRAITCPSRNLHTEKGRKIDRFLVSS